MERRPKLGLIRHRSGELTLVNWSMECRPNLGLHFPEAL